MTSQETAAFVQQVSDSGTHVEASTVLQVRDRSLPSDTISIASLHGRAFISWPGGNVYHVRDLNTNVMLLTYDDFYLRTCTALIRAISLLYFFPLIGVHVIGLKVFTTILDTCQLTLDTRERIIRGTNLHPPSDRHQLILLTANSIQSAITKTKISFGSIYKELYSISHHLPRGSEIWVITFLLQKGFNVEPPGIALSSQFPSLTPILRPGLQGILAPVQSVLSVIILCRFQLDLRERHVKRDDCTLNQSTLGTFHAAIIDEFGDMELIDSMQTR
ncbi:hypothetical protein BU17DRAFT_63671 [Hysterangium stoloniferum]|nr:hypothetical protein BU17DRAFT_63671 [Hysterangium stoloniferum]